MRFRLACITAMSLPVLCGQALDTVLVLDTSPGTEQTVGLIRPGAFEGDDRAGIVGCARKAQVIQPLTQDREALAAALRRAGFRVGIGIRAGVPAGGVQLHMESRVDLAGALRKACGEFGRDGSERRRAIVVFFAGEDPNLSGNMDSLAATLKAADARLYAVWIYRAGSSAVMTSQFLSQLAEASGGRMYRTNWDLPGILADARKP